MRGLRKKLALSLQPHRAERPDVIGKNQCKQRSARESETYRENNGTEGKETRSASLRRQEKEVDIPPGKRNRYTNSSAHWSNDAHKGAEGDRYQEVYGGRKRRLRQKEKLEERGRMYVLFESLG